MSYESYKFIEAMRVIAHIARTIAITGWKNGDRCCERLSALQHVVNILHSDSHNYRQSITTEQDIAFIAVKTVLQTTHPDNLTHTTVRGRLYFIQELCAQAIHDQEKTDTAIAEKREREARWQVEDERQRADYDLITDAEMAEINALDAAFNGDPARAFDDDPDNLIPYG